ncbi:ATP-binding protein [uncultured Winogradskyella sp.]|uniref:sensor histidine kinase n=1 Tax=uncultured Winogradskyella sp. TaxID=395353 RepID=UPI0026289881|nr:ATP-binding protein [uncultured Winogradskyella sp.]
MKTICSCFFLFLFYFNFGQPQKLYHKTYDKTDGIELDSISALAFDNDGFLWLAGSNMDTRTIVFSDTRLELQRFNGFSFDDIPLPLINNQPVIKVNSFYKRFDGEFYINATTASGNVLLLFDPFTVKFDTVSFNGKKIISGLSKVFNYKNQDYILSQSERTITLNIIKSDLSIKKLFSFTSAENKFLVDVASVFIPFKDYCIIGDDNFPITYLDWNGKIIKRHAIDTFIRDRNIDTQKFWLDEVFKVDNTIYGFIENNSVLHKIDSISLEIKPKKNINLNSEHLKTYNDAFGNAMIFNSINNTINFQVLEGNGFSSVYKSKFENVGRIVVASQNLNDEVWLATNGKLHHIKFPKKTVKKYLENLSLRAIKPLDSINYLVATEANGWFTLNTKTDSVYPYDAFENGRPLKPYSSRNIIIEEDTIWSNSNGNIIKIDKNKKTGETYRHYPIICMEKINDSTIIYGTNGYNLMQFNTKTKAHTVLAKTDSLHIYDLEIKKKDNLLVAGTNKGLLTYHLSTKSTAFYNLPSQLEDRFILTLEYHKDYDYLLGTRSGQIVAFNAETKSFTPIYKDDLKAGIATILFDDKTWWINTFNGIVAYNPEDKTSTRFSEKDGLSHFEGNRYSALKTDKGLFFGAIKGLNFFSPKDLKAQNDSASLELLKVKHFDTSKRVFKSDYNREVFNNDYSIVLPSENRALDINFGLKNINAVNNGYSFKYKLNDKDWVELKDKNSIQFPNLASGKYILEIEAEDFSGNKVGESLLVNINSKALFYKTWWFFLLVSLAAISILLWMLKQTNIKNRLQEQFALDLIQSQEDERKRIARELHDSVSQQLTLIKRKAQNNAQSEISDLTNNTLEEVRHISRGLFPPLLKQLGFTESVEQLAIDIDENNELFVSTDIENIDDDLTDENALHLYRFVQECINNSLKHAEAKAISISIDKEKDVILVLIKDNGKGFDVNSAKNKTSLGLKTLEERIKILNGELLIDSKLGKGTTTKAKIHLS